MILTSPITNDEETLNGRDISQRIYELESMEDEPDELMTAEEVGELNSLRELMQYISLDSQLVRDSEMVRFVRDNFSTAQMENWPYNCIDWEQATEEISSDFTSIEFDGVTYWVV